MRSLFLTALIAFLPGCTSLCSNTDAVRADAPAGDLSAVMFRRDCGATTGFSTQISILDRSERPDGKGNVFRADDDHGAAAAGDWAEMKWIASDHLLVRYAENARVFEQEHEFAGVRITYERVNRR